MTPAPMRAVDCQPVDILKLADEIMLEGTRKETSVSQLEIRAMAAGLLDLSVVLGQAATCVTLVGELKAGCKPELRRKAEDALLLLADDLVKHGYLEADHVQRLRS